MPRVQSHTHKLKRHKYSSGNSVFFCVLDCSFKVEVKLSLGKKNICWRCGREFSMNEYSIRLARPHCNNCTKTKIEEKIFVGSNEVSPSNQTVPTVSSLKDRLQNTLSAFAAKPDEGDI